MDSQNRNKQVQCYVCLKIMRSDTLQRHLDSGMEKPEVKEQLLIDNELYYKNVEVGKYVFDMVRSGDIEQQSLSKEPAYALHLHIQQDATDNRCGVYRVKAVAAAMFTAYRHTDGKKCYLE